MEINQNASGRFSVFTTWLNVFAFPAFAIWA
jgi:hypothetical protein